MTPGLVFLVQALVVIVLPIVLLRVLRLKGVMPLVVMQILVGIALGPSVFGRLAPELYHTFVNPASLASLSGIGAVAVLVFGLITGLHLEPGIFRESGRTTSFVAVASILVPTALGCIAGFWILHHYPEELSARIQPAEFAAAVGISTGVTALPVLGAVLSEMDLLRRRIGKLSLAIAGINDIALWVLLGVLLTAVAGQSGGPGMFLMLLLVPVYLAAMVWIVRPMLGHMVSRRLRDGEVRERALAVVGAVTIASAIATEYMGLHYIIGAFLVGAIMPDHLRKPLLDRLQLVTLALLMPFFFMLTGMRTLIDPTSSAFVGIFVLATGVAVVGKVGGSALAARMAGESWPVSFGLGALLQTKGLMEVIVLTILLDAGIISSNVFAALIMMAVVSTALAMPLYRFVSRYQPASLVAEPLVTGAISGGAKTELIALDLSDRASR